MLTIPSGPSALCSLYIKEGGQLPWQVLLAPAIDLALNGFALEERTVRAWKQGLYEIEEYLKHSTLSSPSITPKWINDTRSMLLARRDLQPGERIINRPLAASLEYIALKGCSAFYGKDGPMHKALNYAHSVGSPLMSSTESGELPVSLTHEDWSVRWESPHSTDLKVDHREYTVYAPGGNSQARTSLGILKLLSDMDIDPIANMSRYLHAHITAKRIVYASERLHIGDDIQDPHLPNGPTSEYITELFRKGLSASAADQLQWSGTDTEGISTSDASGKVIALAQSLGNLWGSGLCSPEVGFCLQGRGKGFRINGETHANIYGPGKAPMHTLCAFIVRHKGREDGLDEGSGSWNMGISAKGGDRTPYAMTQMLWHFLKSMQGEPRHLAESIAFGRFRDLNKGAPTPEADASNSFGVTQGRVEWDGPKLVDIVPGYSLSSPLNEHFEDSGFGILHTVLSSEKTNQLQFAASDQTRKDGAYSASVSSRWLQHLPDAKRVLHVLNLKKDIIESMSRVDSTASVHQEKIVSTDQLKFLVNKQRHGKDCSFYTSKPNYPLSGSYIPLSLDSKPTRLEILCSLSQTRGGYRAASMENLINGTNLVGYFGGGYSRFQFVRTGGIFSDMQTIPKERYASLASIKSERHFFPVGIVPLLSPSPLLSYLDESKSGWMTHLTAAGVEQYLPVSVPLSQFANRVVATGSPNGVREVLNKLQLHLPIVIKIDGKTWGTGVVIVKDEPTVYKKCQEAVKRSQRGVVQEAVTGDLEITVNVVAVAGVLFSSSE